MKRELLYGLIPILLIACFSFIGCRNDGIADKLTEAETWSDKAMESVDYLEELLDEQVFSDNPDIYYSLIDTVYDLRHEISEVRFLIQIIKEKYLEEGEY